MIDVYFLNVAKKRNSTYRPDKSVGLKVECVLKDGCDLDNPIFILASKKFNFNYVIWDDHYYFIENVRILANQRYEVSCKLDVLATYKTEILNTTAFVSYSNISGGAWLADDRIPVMKNCIVTKNTVTPEFWETNQEEGNYILSVVGKSGAVSYSVSYADLQGIIDNFDQQSDSIYNTLLAGMNFDTVENAVESVSKMLTKTDILGNAYESAPSCIRSCIFVPFTAGDPITVKPQICLGKFETGVLGSIIQTKPYTGETSINIPWHYSDWRRAYCEQLYLYLPLVGMVGLSSDSLTQSSSITIKWSYTLTDGCISYQIVSGNEIIGSYGGSCATNYPIGIVQEASAGQVVNSMISGAENTVASSIKAGMNVAGFTAEMVMGSLKASYDVLNTTFSTNPTCIGGVGGGAGAGLDKNITLYSVAHSTVVEPGTMTATMGVPTMKPLLLSSCSGYCQCANAHVSAKAHSDNLNEIDAYINSGFFIE